MPQFTQNGAILDDNGFIVYGGTDQYRRLYPQAMAAQQQQAPAGQNPVAGAMPLSPALLAIQAGSAGAAGGGGGGAAPGPATPSSTMLQQAASTADPWAAQRGQYQTALNNLMQGGVSAVANDPSVMARQQAGEQTLARSMAARGFLGSGNILQELQKQGQDIASQEYGNQFSRLATLAGVDKSSPTAAANILAQIPGQNLAEQQTGFNQAVTTQRLPYELTALQNSALQGQQTTEAGAMQNQAMADQMAKMRQAQQMYQSSQGYRPQGMFV